MIGNERNVERRKEFVEDCSVLDSASGSRCKVQSVKLRKT